MSKSNDREHYQSEHGTFEEPDGIIDRDDLAYDTKLDILQSWKADLQRSEVGDDVWLRRVEQAIERLQAQVALAPDRPKRAPSGEGYRPKD